MKLPIKTKVVARLGDTSHLGGMKMSKIEDLRAKSTTSCRASC
jgi:hypothetical protein